jgi:hypothetical protein
MSRSIHTTLHSLKKLKRRKFSTNELREQAISEAEFSLRRKRRIKRQVAGERSGPVADRTLLPGDNIAISVGDDVACVLHAASAEDVRALLALLPPAAVRGISEVRLSLGKAYMAERDPDNRGEPDPLTGRPGSALFPGVYAGDVLGTYWSVKGRIELYAYVADWDRVSVPRAVVTLYLRMQALKTLMHEVAHFHDRVERVRRGRWLSDRSENSEWYAEKMEHEWTVGFVFPYLEKQYGKECRVFRKWLLQRGGIDLPLVFFAGDSRRTERDGMRRLVYSTASVFEYWLEKLPRCATSTDARLALAWELHYADFYVECLQVLNGIIDSGGMHAAVLSCRADTLVHLDRYDEAWRDANEAIRLEPKESGAWESRADVLEFRKDWVGLLESCEHWALVPRMPRSRLRECHRYQAIAHCALGNTAALERCIAAYASTVRFKAPDIAQRRMAVVRRSVFRRAGKDDPSANT